MAISTMENFLGSPRRLRDCHADLRQGAGDRIDVFTAFADDLTRLAHFVRDHRRVGLNLMHQMADLISASPRALRQLANFVGDDGEASSRFARSRRLDGSVERKQISSVCDGGDDLRNLMNVAGLGFEFKDLVACALRTFEDRLHFFDR